MAAQRWCSLLAGLVLAACGNPNTNGDAATDASDANTQGDVPVMAPTYANVQTLFTRSCSVGVSTCHSNSAMRGGLDLSAGNSYAQLINQPSSAIDMPRITPNNPARSFLIHKVENTFSTLPACQGAAGICGEAMPMVSGGMLSPAELAMLRAWVNAGAPSS